MVNDKFCWDTLIFVRKIVLIFISQGFIEFVQRVNDCLWFFLAYNQFTERLLFEGSRKVNLGNVMFLH